jgi:uncharacterized membrane protein YkgB
MKNFNKSKIQSFDKKIIQYLRRYSHKLHRVSLGFFFIWMGLLKVIGYKTNTEIIAHSIYWGDPLVMVYVLGSWELLIGIFFMIRPLVRIALLFLILRIPGILMAFILKMDTCFIHFPLAPTVEGQFLIKDLTIFFAALAIAASLDEKSSIEKRH